MESEWWRGAIIYQIYPRSFFDANDDGTGDLPGINQKLDYISGLGVFMLIPISPFFKSPMRDFGYDVADYRAVNPIFGRIQISFLYFLWHMSADLRSLSTWFWRIPPISIFGLRRAPETGRTKKRNGTSGPTRNLMVSLQITGRRFSAARPGNGSRAAGSITFTIIYAPNRI